MLDFELLQNQGIIRVHPETPLLARDFAQLSETVDRYLAGNRQLKGIVISAEDQLGWEDFSELVSHIRFDGDHHRIIPRVAAVSDEPLAGILPPIEHHFAAAEVRRFSSEDFETAISWVQDSN
ncbi:STAS/SEC14 domain-containing protein [Pseudomaricurvus alkylphenolicus]|uniref:STAS/SEC14 domain-containing protein n=1 Tax=Pseudomaricurvus alkylphenolicus TaxID=1306991 RepID=UPI00141FA2BD|nr:STAS/SEC14 domain-containing protein [Pseudomaricurvus alkylphenolicus]NIB44276.1 STAS/SEC14 domain-containing protein [Pseudomaricurvus alkylphenolicus]